MKKGSSILTLLAVIMTLLGIGCGKNTPKNSVEIPNCDSVNVYTSDGVAGRDNIEISNRYKQIEDSIIREMQNVHFFSSRWGQSYGDTVIDGLEIRYNCVETTYPDDYIRRPDKYLNEYGEWVEKETITYGNRAGIIFSPTTDKSKKTDTVIITRKLLVDKLGRNDESWRNSKYILSHLRLDDVRNDSIIFSVLFYMNETDCGDMIYLKFAKDNPAGDFDIEFYISPDDEYDM